MAVEESIQPAELELFSLFPFRARCSDSRVAASSSATITNHHRGGQAHRSSCHSEPCRCALSPCTVHIQPCLSILAFVHSSLAYLSYSFSIVYENFNFPQCSSMWTNLNNQLVINKWFALMRNSVSVAPRQHPLLVHFRTRHQASFSTTNRDFHRFRCTRPDRPFAKINHSHQPNLLSR